MKQEDFFEILGDLDENHVVEAEEPVKTSKSKGRRLMFAVGMVAAACLCLYLFGGRSSPTVRTDGSYRSK